LRPPQWFATRLLAVWQSTKFEFASHEVQFGCAESGFGTFETCHHPVGTPVEEIKRASDAFGLDFNFMKDGVL
jgi:hypothetical protein